MNKYQKGNAGFGIVLLVIGSCFIAIILTSFDKQRAYNSITPNKVYEERTGDSFKRKQITIIDRRDNYIKFRTADGSEMTMPFDNFFSTFKEYKKDNINGN